MPLNILLVEDHVDTLDLLFRVLSKWGYEHTVAQSAAEALRIAAETRFHLLLCDYQLGDGTCCDVLANIRRLYPIHGVAITGHGDEMHREQAIAAGYTDYLVKPISLPLLKEIIDAVESRVKCG